MNTIEIKIALLRAGIKQRWIAKKFGVSDEMISQVIHGKKTSKRIQDYIRSLVNKKAA